MGVGTVHTTIGKEYSTYYGRAVKVKDKDSRFTFDPRVEDAEPEPVEVVVERGDVVDVEVHRGRPHRRRTRRLLALGGVAAGGGGLGG